MRKLALLLAVVAIAACKKTGSKEDEFVGLGLKGANSEPPPGIFRPIGDGDLPGVQGRGRLLYDMERVLELATLDGAEKAGIPPDEVIMPLVDVDPGGRSGQVVFLRWKPDKVGSDGSVHPKDAERWLLVSLLLRPDRVLDVELLHGPVVEDGLEYARAFAVIAAAERLREQFEGASFHMFTVREDTPAQKKTKPNKILTRVYALSADGSGPDVEVVVDQPKRRRKPGVLESVVVHPAGSLTGEAWQLKGTQPAPATVARVMLRGPDAGEVGVQARGGAFVISAADGRVSRRSGP